MQKNACKRRLKGPVSFAYAYSMELHGSIFGPITVLIATVLRLLEVKMPSSTSCQTKILICSYF